MSGPEMTEDALLDELSIEQRQRLTTYLDRLLSVNEEMNLTAISNRDEAWQRHIVESLRIVKLFGDAPNLIDVGSGGGIPGLVIAIACPQLDVTLLEATEKKARFLDQTAKSLGLTNVRVLAERAELAAAAGAKRRESFELVTARAVAPLRVLLELTVPFLKVGGRLVAVKGERAETELAESADAQRLLGVTLEHSERHPTATVLVLRKTHATPKKYPRRAGEPKKNPL
ncbi:MAG: 16S rRNA (guanine(527)-N(7))-methyltransferase RsmG [Anaeromyxobacter sp.]